MPSLIGLNQSIFAQTDQRRADVVLYELHERTDDIDGRAPLAFQYFPESLQDTKAVNYQQKEIPGASLPLYQWISSGERLISFTANFTADVDVTKQEQARSGPNARRNPDIRSALLWLRRFLLPRYTSESGPSTSATPTTYARTYAPRKVRLYIPNSGIGLSGGGQSSADISEDAIYCLITQCEITYESFFASGLPQSVEVQLSFAEVAQLRGRVFFPSASAATDNLVYEGRPAGSTDSIFSYNIQPRVLPKLPK